MVRPQIPNELIGNAEFIWLVHECGYRWVDHRAVYPAAAPPREVTRDRVLIPTMPLGPNGAEEVEYDPLAEAAMFVTFANTPPDENGLLGFANRFGYLRAIQVSGQQDWSGALHDSATPPAELALSTGGRTVVAVERYSTWREEVIAMKESLDLWGMCVSGERERVARRLSDILFDLKPLPKPRGRRTLPSVATDKAYQWYCCLALCVNLLMTDGDARRFCAEFGASLDDTWYEGWKKRPPSRQAMWWVNASKSLRRELATAPEAVIGVGRQLVRARIDQRLQRETHGCMNWDDRRDRAVLGMTPGNLLGAMWLQFAQEVTGQAQHRPCKVCGKWLTISSDDYGFRSDREFCSAACRQKDYRTKIKDARGLREQGLTVRQLAKRFDTTTNTINNWLAKGN
jgi:hypothetical protein